MTFAFESDGVQVSDRGLLLRGIGMLIVIAAAAALMIAKSEGAFQKTVKVTAALVNVGDGLPPKSDVKFHGVLVGQVAGVTPSTDGGPNYVHIDLFPAHASGIPDTVTARVVPSNVFAVPSIQLIDHGRGPALRGGEQIPEDRSLATVRLQTSLTALSRIVAAAGRSGADATVGVLTTIERATSGRGAAALQAGGQLRQIVAQLDAVMTPTGGPTTMGALTTALAGLQSAAPDLLGAVHDAVAPMRVIAQQRAGIESLLSGGLTTTTTIGTALRHNTGTITDITAKMSPVLEVIAEGGKGFVKMTSSVRTVASAFNNAWDPKTQSLTAAIILEFTPHTRYTRADCPRYGDLAGASCVTGPPGAHSILQTTTADVDGGNVGSVGSRAEEKRIAELFGGRPNAAADLLAGPVLRGNDVTVRTTGAPR